MKATVMTAAGDPSVLVYQEYPEPELQSSTDVLVKLKAAGINPIDTKLRQRGTFFPDRMPAVLGLDGAGVVEAVGPDVRQFHVGDEVYFCNGGLGAHPGTYAEYAVVDEAFLAPKPATLSFAEAAAVPLVAITAWEALFDRGRLQSGQTVLVQAGAGGVGHVAIQLAKQHGARVCATVSSLEKATMAHNLGADLVIRYAEVDPVQTVLDWTEGKGVDLALDTVGGTVLSQCFAATKIYGDVVTILAPDAETTWKVARDRNLRFSFELMLTPLLQGLKSAQEAQTEILRQCARRIDSGDLKIHLAQTFPLEQAAEAHKLLEQGGFLGKLALVME
ncbi:MULTISPECIES: zinc-dependent alcohol dehydrogenase family protein [unclassified Leptolyngbya]|uniref:zinc-dependent alcohol dehydrogenase family protein n=1 Tax=unclassified Leptolyngbya TaxID=2650499 RepID=UPI001689EFE3|nr:MULTISPECIES: zinc-dependent alcohol dehydrogenase family protein [unclassified Leptolyngbya]MBD1913352.1 zinc-dependent alcohol dehydrogenase family protein [Leptolyngbya sp. FACHB-8]MBD2154507.1 zinc-dependent alcohol dehydrogenase family protein [Leptolyngbya sp. FACHB-16]